MVLQRRQGGPTRIDGRGVIRIGRGEKPRAMRGTWRNGLVMMIELSILWTSVTLSACDVRDNEPRATGRHPSHGLT